MLKYIFVVMLLLKVSSRHGQLQVGHKHKSLVLLHAYVNNNKPLPCVQKLMHTKYVYNDLLYNVFSHLYHHACIALYI